jgi:hypothetical protein
MYRNKTINTKLFKPNAANEYSIFLKRSPILVCLGYEVDTLSSFSLTMPAPAKLDQFASTEYQQAVNDLRALYNSGSGVWWSGDEYGQHRHINLKGKEEQHEILGQQVHKRWMSLICKEIQSVSPKPPDEDLRLHEEFSAGFQTWLTERRKLAKIMVGNDSDGIESLMYGYIMMGAKDSALTGRRLAVTSSGRISIVPRHVQTGDSVVFLAGSLIPCVLRGFPIGDGENGENEIKQMIVKERLEEQDSGRREILKKISEKALTHCALIGEAYVEGEVGWTLREERPQTVFALS